MRSFEDGLLSIAALAIAATLGWKTIGATRDAPLPPSQPAEAPVVFATTVLAIAEAVAIAEGYYAPGIHDGRSLPYALNNPGGLKKPALGAADLPTWEDTGLVIFPSKEMGWGALHHQICLMLTGKSRIYDPTDSLLAVGMKYADGDRNWGTNVAARLDVSPSSSLADLAVGPLAVLSPAEPACRTLN